MCSDKPTLSAYVDGEVAGAEYRSINEHLKLCSKCRKEVELINSLKMKLKKVDHEADYFTREAVWTRLAHSTSTTKGLDFWHRGFVVSPSLMISLSFLFIAVFGLGLFFAIPRNTDFLSAANNSGSTFDSAKFPLEVSIDKVENILAYFDIHDEASEVFIQLPGSSNFIIQGEPRFLKKNDYDVGY